MDGLPYYDLLGHVNIYSLSLRRHPMNGDLTGTQVSADMSSTQNHRKIQVVATTSPLCVAPCPPAVASSTSAVLSPQPRKAESPRSQTVECIQHIYAPQGSITRLTSLGDRTHGTPACSLSRSGAKFPAEIGKTPCASSEDANQFSL